MKRTLTALALIPALAAAQSLQFGPPPAISTAADTAVSSGTAQPLDSIGLVINEEAISRSQLQREMQAAAAQIPAELRNRPEMQQVLLERVIMEHLIRQLAERVKIQISEEQLDQAVGRIASQNNVSVDTLYSRAQKETGMSREAFRNNVRTQLVQAQLKEIVAGSNINITAQQIDDQMTQIARQRGSTLHLQDLLLPIPDLPVDQRGAVIAENIAALSAALQANNNDLNLAAKSLTGAHFADLGEVNVAQIPARFTRAVVGVPSGQMADTPVIDADGMHFLKVISKSAAGADAHAYIVPEARMAHILIRGDKHNPQQAKHEIDRIYALLQQGADFGELARRYSQDPGSAAKGGDLGWMSADSVDPRFAQQLKNVPLNQISEPFESAFGWHIIRVSERRDADRSEERIREQIRDALYQSALQDAWEQQLLQLRQAAYIDIRL